eukprot:140572_1
MKLILAQQPTVLPTTSAEESNSFIQIITDNYIYAVAACFGLFCACCMLCVLCIKKRQQTNSDIDAQRKKLKETQFCNSDEQQTKIATNNHTNTQTQKLNKKKKAIVKFQQQQPQINDTYSFQFSSKPFVLTFGKTKDKKNLYVTGINDNSAASKSNITIGSIVIK